MLQSAGYDVIAARAAPDALKLLEQGTRPVRLLLTDLVLPGMNGRELAAAVTAAHPSIRVLYTTGYTDDRLARERVERGKAFITKPYTSAQLTRKVREVLDEPDNG
jgi:CheY-like chemotaxis protein